MKKSLLAVAAIGAFASAAQAQSSVTVYGILDMGYIGSNQRLAANTGGTAGVTKATTGGFAQGGESSTRLGFKGTEDLGGGTSAFFTYEVALGMNDANSQSTVSNQNRQAFVGLAKKGLGNFALGTQYTPIHTNVGLTSANGQNNVMGDIIYTGGTTSNFAQAAATVGSPANAAIPSTSLAASSNAGYTVRAANMLSVQTEDIGGLKGQAFYVANGMNNQQTAYTAGTTQTGGTNDRNGWGAAANFSMAKFLATANYQSFKATNPYAVSGDSAANGQAAIFGSAAQSGQNMADNQFYFGATYDFGILKAYAQYINRKSTSEINTSLYSKRTAQQIGVKANLTPTIETWASVGTGAYYAMGTNVATTGLKQNLQAYQVGSNYYLSKRTNLYAIFGATNASVNTTSNAAYNGNNYAAGIRHTF
jgi:predicted porin